MRSHTTNLYKGHIKHHQSHVSQLLNIYRTLFSLLSYHGNKRIRDTINCLMFLYKSVSFRLTSQLLCPNSLNFKHAYTGNRKSSSTLPFPHADNFLDRLLNSTPPSFLTHPFEYIILIYFGCVLVYIITNLQVILWHFYTYYVSLTLLQFELEFLLFLL